MFVVAASYGTHVLSRQTVISVGRQAAGSLAVMLCKSALQENDPSLQVDDELASVGVAQQSASVPLDEHASAPRHCTVFAAMNNSIVCLSDLGEMQIRLTFAKVRSDLHLDLLPLLLCSISLVRLCGFQPQPQHATR